MDLLPDTEAAKAILADSEAAEAAFQAQMKVAFDQWRATTEEIKQALAIAPARG